MQIILEMKVYNCTDLKDNKVSLFCHFDDEFKSYTKSKKRLGTYL